VQELQPLLKQFPDGHHPTFFEVVTVMALKFFAEQHCDLVIWETGLGGRLDATNIVTPLASVITNIQFDHEQWLGDTLAKIAGEKADIIKPGVPVITAVNEPEALKVIEEVARKQNAPLVMVDGRDAALRRPDSAARCPYLSLAGDHQQLNAALSLAAVGALQKQIPVTAEAIHAGLQNVNWPGRLQLVTLPDNRRILLDGAHNVAGVKALCDALKKNFPAGKRTLVLGVLQDKDWRHICEMLAPLSARIFTVPVSSERSTPPGELTAACRAANPAAEIFTCASLREVLEKIARDDFVVITGSLYLVGEALELLGLSPSARDERGLNEWTAGALPPRPADKLSPR
jgi:dihydrofolate synthase/folylpolyglutamate synthase